MDITAIMFPTIMVEEEEMDTIIMVVELQIDQTQHVLTLIATHQEHRMQLQDRTMQLQDRKIQHLEKAHIHLEQIHNHLEPQHQAVLLQEQTIHHQEVHQEEVLVEEVVVVFQLPGAIQFLEVFPGAILVGL